MLKRGGNMKKAIYLIVIAMVLLAAALNIKEVFSILGWILSACVPVLAGLSIAFVLNVPLSFFEHKVFAFMDKSDKKFMPVLKKSICVILTILLVLAIIVLIGVVIIPALIDAIKNIIASAGEYAKVIPDWIEGLLKKLKVPEEIISEYSVDREVFIDNIVNFIRNKASNLISKTALFTVTLASKTFSILLSFVVAIYALACKERVKRFSNRLLDCFVKEKAAETIRTVASVAFKSFSGFISGQFLENLLLGVLCFIGMSIFNFPYAGAVSVLVAVAQLVPVVGGIVSAIASSLLMLTDSPLTALFFLIFIIIVQQIEGNLIYPKVVGDKVGLPGIAVISAVIIGGNLFGILGVLIGIPLVSTVYALLKMLMDDIEKKRKGDAHEDAAS